MERGQHEQDLEPQGKLAISGRATLLHLPADDGSGRNCKPWRGVERTGDIAVEGMGGDGEHGGVAEDPSHDEERYGNRDIVARRYGGGETMARRHGGVNLCGLSEM